MFKCGGPNLHTVHDHGGEPRQVIAFLLDTNQGGVMSYTTNIKVRHIRRIFRLRRFNQDEGAKSLDGCGTHTMTCSGCGPSCGESINTHQLGWESIAIGQAT